MSNTTQTPESNPRDLVDGQYVEKVQGAPQITVTAMVKRPERDVLNAELEPGDVIIGDDGSGRLTVYEVGSSSALPGCLRLETNFGPLYLDQDGSSRVAADAERHYEFDFDSMTEGEAGDVFQDAKLKFGWSGTYFSEEDINEEVEQLIQNKKDFGEPVNEDVDRAAICALVRASYTWRHLPDRMSETGNGLVQDRTSEAYDEVAAEAAAKQDAQPDAELRG